MFRKGKSLGTESGSVGAWGWGWRVTETDGKPTRGIFWEQ